MSFSVVLKSLIVAILLFTLILTFIFAPLLSTFVCHLPDLRFVQLLTGMLHGLRYTSRASR